MAEYRVYWKNFARESKAGDWPCTRWFTSSKVLGRARAGDHLWLFTAGFQCGMAEAQAAYLVEVFTVERVSVNPGSEPGYPSGEFQFVVQGEPSRCVKLDPPLVVDHLLRSEKHGPSVPIGRLLQGPRRLSPARSDRLLECLRSGWTEVVRQAELKEHGYGPLFQKEG